MLIPATGSLWSVYPNDAYILSHRVGNAHHMEDTDGIH